MSTDDLIEFDPGSVGHPGINHNQDSYIRYRALTTGDHYISIEYLQDPGHPTSGAYQLQVSIGTPATAQQILEEDAEALLSGSEWDTLSPARLQRLFDFPPASAMASQDFGATPFNSTSASR